MVKVCIDVTFIIRFLSLISDYLGINGAFVVAVLKLTCSVNWGVPSYL